MLTFLLHTYLFFAPHHALPLRAWGVPLFPVFSFSPIIPTWEMLEEKRIVPIVKKWMRPLTLSDTKKRKFRWPKSFLCISITDSIIACPFVEHWEGHKCFTHIRSKKHYHEIFCTTYPAPEGFQNHRFPYHMNLEQQYYTYTWVLFFWLYVVSLQISEMQNISEPMYTSSHCKNIS